MARPAKRPAAPDTYAAPALAIVPPPVAAILKAPDRPDTSGADFRAHQAQAKPDGLLRKLDSHALIHEGRNHVQHEAIVALISRLSTVKHHLARLAGMHFDAAIDADLAALARLL